MTTSDKQELIVVAYDFTEAAEAALSHANSIAKSAANSEVRLLHVINSESKSKLKKANEHESAIYERLQSITEKNQMETGVKTSYHAEEGTIFKTIGEYLQDSNASMMVLGTHGVKGIQHIVGAFAMKVISSSPVPVIVVQNKKSPAEGYKKIVVAIDDYKLGKNKIVHTISMAQKFNSEVFLFVDQSSDQLFSAQIRGNLGHAVKYLEINNIKHSYTITPSKGGSFGKQLLKYSQSIDADLIVISSQKNMQNIADLLLIVGKTEESIINNDSETAVLCVNPLQNVTNIGVLGV